MSEGFFPLSLVTGKAPPSLIPKCGECGLYKKCHSPKMKVDGKGRERILVVGEAPGENEDEQGKPFVGRAGRHLQKAMARHGIDLRNDCWLVNSLACRPPKNRTPEPEEIEACRPNVSNAIRDLNPEVILCLGAPAVVSVLGSLWKENMSSKSLWGRMGTWHGWEIPLRKPNCWILPCYHPSFVLRNEEKDKVPGIMFEDVIKNLATKTSRPWKVVPDERSQVKILYDAEEVRKAMAMMFAFGKPVAIDYETNMMKPDHPDSEIVCCSLSDGDTTIAFPWTPQMRPHVERFVLSPIPKITATKFELRWSEEHLYPARFNNWFWDVTESAHVLDCREGITGLKFQVLVNFGAPSYNDHIEPYLKSDEKGGYAKNRIREVEIGELMLYCGLDSLYEWKLAMKQRKAFGYDK